MAAGWLGAVTGRQFPRWVLPLPICLLRLKLPGSDQGMMMSGKCSGCGKSITTANIEQMKATNRVGVSLVVIAFKCPDCDVLIGMQADPIEERKTLLKEVEKLLIKWK